MQRIGLWLLGLALGALFGALLVALFAPVSGDAFRKRLQLGYQETLDDARRASQERQAELETQLSRLQGK